MDSIFERLEDERIDVTRKTEYLKVYIDETQDYQNMADFISVAEKLLKMDKNTKTDSIVKFFQFNH